jgi:hypothetical protein
LVQEKASVNPYESNIYAVDVSVDNVALGRGTAAEKRRRERLPHKSTLPPCGNLERDAENPGID